MSQAVSVAVAVSCGGAGGIKGLLKTWVVVRGPCEVEVVYPDAHPCEPWSQSACTRTRTSPALPLDTTCLSTTLLLSLFLSLTITVLTTPPILHILHYWLTRLLHNLTCPAAFFLAFSSPSPPRPHPHYPTTPDRPSALHPPRGGMVSAYWATWHALGYHNVGVGLRAARTALLCLLFLFPLLLVLPEVAGVLHASGTAVLAALGEAGACLLLWSIGAQWAAWVLRVVVGGVLRGTRQVVGEVARFWREVLGRCWPALVVAGAGWMLFSLAREVDYEEVLDETLKGAFLACALVVYRVGDLVRDLAKVFRVE